MKNKKMPWLYNFIQGSCYYFLRLFYRLKVYGNDFSYSQKAIIAPNHASFIDPPIIAGTWPKEIHYLGSDYLFKIPLFNKFIAKVNTHPIQRGKADISSIKLVCKLLNENKQILIFPEGTRSYDGQIAPLKNGVSVIAHKCQAAVIPVYIHGSYDIWSRHRIFPKLWGKLAIVYGSPILFEDFAGLDSKQYHKALLERLMGAILGLKAWYENGAQGTPP